MAPKATAAPPQRQLAAKVLVSQQGGLISGTKSLALKDASLFVRLNRTTEAVSV